MFNCCAADFAYRRRGRWIADSVLREAPRSLVVTRQRAIEALSRLENKGKVNRSERRQAQHPDVWVVTSLYQDVHFCVCARTSLLKRIIRLRCPSSSKPASGCFTLQRSALKHLPLLSPCLRFLSRDIKAQPRARTDASIWKWNSLFALEWKWKNRETIKIKTKKIYKRKPNMFIKA